MNFRLKRRNFNDEPAVSQIRTPQDKVNALNEEKEFFVSETASSSGMSHVPSQPSRSPSPEVCSAAILDCRTAPGTRWVLQEMFLKIHLIQKEYLRPYQEVP